LVKKIQVDVIQCFVFRGALSLSLLNGKLRCMSSMSGSWQHSPVS